MSGKRTYTRRAISPAFQSASKLPSVPYKHLVLPGCSHAYIFSKHGKNFVDDDFPKVVRGGEATKEWME